MTEGHTQNVQYRDKLYVITRRDLTPGQQLAQSLHAAFEFSIQHPEITKEWNQNSNFICALAAANEKELVSLIKNLEKHNARFSVFRESDLNNEITAVAIEPGPVAKRFTRYFPLALKGVL